MVQAPSLPAFGRHARLAIGSLSPESAVSHYALSCTRMLPLVQVPNLPAFGRHARLVIGSLSPAAFLYPLRMGTFQTRRSRRQDPGPSSMLLELRLFQRHDKSE